MHQETAQKHQHYDTIKTQRKNSIAFGSAPGREADSQPISRLVRQSVSHSGSQSGKQAGRQADRSTQFGFFQWWTPLQAKGMPKHRKSVSGRAVMQSTGSRQDGGSNPGQPTTGSADRPTSFILLDPRSNPSEHNPPPPPPGKKVISSFRGYRPQNSKIHWDLLLGKIMILQGVGQPISCLGVCYASDPPKGGKYNARACA